MTTVIRLKSDNFDCWVSEDAYEVIILQMSSGDYGVHKHREVQVSPDQLDNLKYHSGRVFVDYIKPDYRCEQNHENCWLFYDGNGDCNIEEELNYETN